MLDIRLPIGLMFLVKGIILFIYGLLTNGSEIYVSHSLGMNVNLYWGIVLAIFGATMFFLSRKSAGPDRRDVVS